MFSLACNLTKNNVQFLPVEISSKKLRANKADFSTREITSKNVSGKKADISTKKVHGNNVDFSTIEITPKKNVETTWIFQAAKLHRIVCGNDVEICRNLVFDVST